jgi:hypothetical protein
MCILERILVSNSWEDKFSLDFVQAGSRIGSNHNPLMVEIESPSLVLVINDTKLLMPYVKWFKLGISNTCDEGACGMEWWPQDHKRWRCT